MFAATLIWSSIFHQHSGDSSMASGRSASVSVTLLFFTTFTQALYGISSHHVDSINATVGKRVHLPCMMEKGLDSSITQITWKKSVEGQEYKIVIYNPRFGPPIFYRKNISLHLENSGGKLRGSILQLPDLEVWDSGHYVCELTTFPLGTMKTDIHLWVTDVQLSARVTWPNRGVREGDNVTILCNSTPPADFYSLWPSKNKSSIFKSKVGKFTLYKVTRHDSDLYICQPGNSGLFFHDHNVTVQVTVDYPVQLSIRVMSPNQDVREGDEVLFLCNSTPPADKYQLWTPTSLSLTSAGGELKLPKASKDDGGLYTCRPQWTSGPPFDGDNVTVELHVFPQVTSGQETSVLTLTQYFHLLVCIFALTI